MGPWYRAHPLPGNEFVPVADAQTTVRHGRAFQQIGKLGVRPEWIRKNKQPAAGYCVTAVVLITHMKYADRVMPLDE